ncbi:MAG: hypothetical protein OHK0029_36780 [Armatimonadaceae bacterium]
MPGLDEFYRFIESKDANNAPTNGEMIAEPGTGNSPVAYAANGTNNGTNGSHGSSARVRYVMRNGITVAEPISGDSTDDAENGAPDVVPTEEAASASKTEDESGAEEALAMWRRLPRHIQVLASISEPEEEEVAQKYYTRDFKETRQQLIQRLLNPTLTLEETARVLGVCPATVRRYTNRGVLPHFRTVGQQRRFRLSDVLVFLEQQEQVQTGRRGRRPRRLTAEVAENA